MLFWAPLLWVGLSLLAAYYASTQGRNAVGFFFLSLAISPLLALIFAAANPDRAALARQRMNTPRKCPFCAERVKPDAIKCRHCGSDLRSQVARAQSQRA